MTLRDVSKSFGDKTIYTDLSLELGDEVTAVLGRSGCGKTTLLNLIAGILTPDGGRIEGQGRVSYVFQSPRLLPHLTALGNLLYAGIDRTAALDALAACGVAENLYPRELSGGMAQRVGLARAFAVPADTVLMDEPFKSLDLGLKHRLLALTRELFSDRRVILVTHDVAEAEFLADRAIVLDGGRIVYDAPKSDGRFIGLTEKLCSL